MKNTLADKNPLKITVYADLNCPYCYALNERLDQIGKSQSVVWRPIEHAPDLFRHSFSDIDKQELIHEVSDVMSRAPDILLQLPDFRPNSRLASQLLATIIKSHPDKNVDFRNAVYRALWQQGQDISDIHVLNQLLQSIDLPGLESSNTADNDLITWHTEWELGQFARNIPSMESSNGFKLLGFPPINQLEDFLLQGWSKVTNFEDASCVSSKRYSIAVISETPDKWTKPKLLEAISQYQHYHSTADLINDDSRTQPLDIIILVKQPNSIKTIKHLKESAPTLNVPIFLISNDESIQVEAYRSGVADITNDNTQEEVLGHRIVRILHTKRSAEKLFEIARIDFLTGLYNRREFDTVIKKEWRQMQRDNKPLSLLMIDMDSFKDYNDTYGHSMGDEVLRRFAQILKSCTKRATDLCVRYGGEEFAIILPDVDLKGALHVAELIRSQTEAHDIKHVSSSVEPHITISIGVTEATPSTGQSMEEFVDQADKALYKAKENGRNQVFNFS